MNERGIKWIDRCLFESPCYIGVCRKEKDFNHIMKKYNMQDSLGWIRGDNDATTHTFIANGKPIAIVCIGDTLKKNEKIENIGLLIHESIHVWDFIKKLTGEYKPSKEFEAYAIQSIAQRLIKKAEIIK